jgi:hypothetical protein
MFGLLNKPPLRSSPILLMSKVERFDVSTDSIESHQEFIKKHGCPHASSLKD